MLTLTGTAENEKENTVEQKYSSYVKRDISALLHAKQASICVHKAYTFLF